MKGVLPALFRGSGLLSADDGTGLVHRRRRQAPLNLESIRGYLL